MVLWMTTISVSVALLVVTAAMGISMPAFSLVHFLITGMVASVMAILALREARATAAAGGTRALVAAGLTRHMGLLWAWAALVIVVTYGTAILEWSPWWQYFLSFMVFSGLCLFVSKVITEDQLAGRPDDKMQRVCLGLAATTLFIVVMAVGAIGFARLAGHQPHETGAWAADHVFVFGGIAMAVVAGFLLKTATVAAPNAAAADPA
jgi:hypothetical protein